MDPRLKLTYFKENGFDSKYIKTCKQQITDLWKSKYKPDENQESIISISKQTALTNHIFKKRKVVYKDELESYLKEPASNFDIDSLSYWKV